MNPISKLWKKLSFELKLSIALVITATLILLAITYPIISHKPVPFDVAAPRGQILILENITIGSYHQENAVDLWGILALKGNEDYGDEVTLSISEPWCFDLLYWNGHTYAVKARCAQNITMSRYAFLQTGRYYWYLERGYHLIAHRKEGEPHLYERVYITAKYGPAVGEGSFTVAFPRE